MKNKLFTLILAIVSSSTLFAETTDSTNAEINHAIYVSPLYLLKGGIHADYEFIVQNRHGLVLGGTYYSGVTDTENDDRLKDYEDTYKGSGLDFTYKYYFTSIKQKGTAFYVFGKYTYNNLIFTTPYYKTVRYYDSSFEATLIAELFDEDATLKLQMHGIEFGVGFLIFTNKHIIFDIETGLQTRKVNYSGETVNERTYKRHAYDWGAENTVPIVKARFGVFF